MTIEDVATCFVCGKPLGCEHLERGLLPFFRAQSRIGAISDAPEVVGVRKVATPRRDPQKQLGFMHQIQKFRTQ